MTSATVAGLDRTGHTARHVLATRRVGYPGRVTVTAPTLTVPDAPAAVDDVDVIRPSDVITVLRRMS
jgi:hypothetical protein